MDAVTKISSFEGVSWAWADVDATTDAVASRTLKIVTAHMIRTGRIKRVTNRTLSAAPALPESVAFVPEGSVHRCRQLLEFDLPDLESAVRSVVVQLAAVAAVLPAVVVLPQAAARPEEVEARLAAAAIRPVEVVVRPASLELRGGSCLNASSKLCFALRSSGFIRSTSLYPSTA